MKKHLQTFPPLFAFFAPFALLGALALPALASPGAHGPNGEHLDTPNQSTSGAPASPRMETKTEQFELVATLAGGELALLIDRFETNEPLLDALVEVESDGLKAQARFHADHGDYAVDDEAMLTQLGKQGDHALLITVLAGKESDLLEGVLNVPTTSAQGTGTAHAPADGWWRVAKWSGGGLLLGLCAAFLLRKRGAGVASKKLEGDRT
jgi:hypothetical protein